MRKGSVLPTAKKKTPTAFFVIPSCEKQYQILLANFPLRKEGVV